MQRTHAFHAGVKVPLTPSEHERTSKQVVDWSVLYSVGDDRRGPYPGVHGLGAVNARSNLVAKEAL